MASKELNAIAPISGHVQNGVSMESLAQELYTKGKQNIARSGGGGGGGGDGGFDLRSRIGSQTQGGYGPSSGNQKDYRNQRDHSSDNRGGGSGYGGSSNYNNRDNVSSFPLGQNKFAALSANTTQKYFKQSTVTQSQPNVPTANEVFESIAVDMEEWEKTNCMYLFSSYGFAKDVVCLPGFHDFSPEEVRLRAYDAQASGHITPYTQWYDQLKSDIVQKRRELMLQHRPFKFKLNDVVEAILNAPTYNSSGSANIGTLFTGYASDHPSFGDTTNTVPTGPTPGLFGPNSPLAGGVFGGNAPAAGLFGNIPQTSNPAAAGIFTSTPNPGAPASTVPPTGLFGKPPSSTAPPTGLFGKPPQASQIPSLFPPSNPQQTSPAANLFGAPTQTAQVPSMANASNSNSVFGGQPSTQVSGFGPNNAFGQSGSINNAGFGASAVPSNQTVGGFGQQQPPQTSQAGFSAAASSNMSSVFGATSGSSQTVKSVNTVTGQAKTPQYTALGELTAEEKTAFQAQKFVLGKIPTRPPPRELVH